MSARLGFQAIYTVAELAKAARITTPRMRRTLRACKVEMIQAGRQLMVPLDEIREKIPALFRNLALVDELTSGRPSRESNAHAKRIECVESVEVHGRPGPDG